MSQMRRGVLLSALIAVAVVASLTGWYFGSRIRSPAEVAADAQPPEPSNITVEVTSQVLSADVITRGDVVYDEPVELVLSGSFAEQPESLVVTQSVEVDAELREGAVAVEVAGRPVFLLQGEIPMYRDLRPGASGDDVFQIEQALTRLGHFDGIPDDEWDTETGASVAAWYADAGYLPNGLSRADEESLTAARDRVRAAEATLAETQAMFVEARSGPDASTLLAAEAEVEAADDARALARLDAERANELAAETAETAADDLAAARRALTRATRRLEAARDGAHPDTGRPPTRDQLVELRQAVQDAEAAVEEAETLLEAAEFEKVRVATEQRSLLRLAGQRLDIARATLSDLRSPPDTSAISRQVDLASRELSAAQRDRNELEAGLGTWIAAGEIVFLPRLPVRVDLVPAARGDVIAGSFITVSGSEVMLRASVLERDAGLLEPGMEVEIDSPDGDVPIAGTIVTVADRPGTDGVAGDRVAIECLPETLPEGLVGSNVRVRIPVSSTGGEVLAVPAAALSATADGSTQLEVENADGTLRVVGVEPGLAAGGLVQVTPVDGELAEGDLVVVGREQSS